MRTRTHKLLQVLLALALAIAPLRGAWAAPDMTAPAATDSSPAHCEHMQHGKPADNAAHGMHAGHNVAMQNSGPCDHDCGGSCCDASCNACVHATPAIPGAIRLLSGSAAETLHTTPSPLFPERPAIPLLHPPATSRS